MSVIRKHHNPSVSQIDNLVVVGRNVRLTLRPTKHNPVVLTAPRPEVDVTLRGVTLGFIISLVETKMVCASDTVQMVVENFVRPRTASTR